MLHIDIFIFIFKWCTGICQVLLCTRHLQITPLPHLCSPTYPIPFNHSAPKPLVPIWLSSASLAILCVSNHLVVWPGDHNRSHVKRICHCVVLIFQQKYTPGRIQAMMRNSGAIHAPHPTWPQRTTMRSPRHCSGRGTSFALLPFSSDNSMVLEASGPFFH